MTLRQLYISTGAIVPAGLRVQEPAPPCLYLDNVGHIMAEAHILEDQLKAQAGELCEIPLDQVPDFVLTVWEKRERAAAHAAYINEPS